MSYPFLYLPTIVVREILHERLSFVDPFDSSYILNLSCTSLSTIHPSVSRTSGAVPGDVIGLRGRSSFKEGSIAET